MLTETKMNNMADNVFIQYGKEKKRDDFKEICFCMD